LNRNALKKYSKARYNLSLPPSLPTTTTVFFSLSLSDQKEKQKQELKRERERDKDVAMYWINVF
jgi:hypothetical protein